MKKDNVRTEVIGGRFYTGYKEYLQRIADTKTALENKRVTIAMLVAEAVEKAYPPPMIEKKTEEVKTFLDRL